MRKAPAVMMFTLLIATFTWVAAQQAQSQEPTREVGALRFILLAPEVSNVDVLVNGELVFFDVSPGTPSGYSLFPMGEHLIEVVAVPVPGQTVVAPNDPEESPNAPEESPAVTPLEPVQPGRPLGSLSVTLEPGSYHTVVATLAGGPETVSEGAQGAQEGPQDPAASAGQPDVQLQVFTNPFTTFPPAGQALLGIVHTSPDATTIDVVGVRREDANQDQEQEQPAQEPQGEAQAPNVEEPQVEGEGPAPIDGRTLVSALPTGGVSEYHLVPAGTYHLQVRMSGRESVAIDLSNMVLESGTIYTFYTYGHLEDENLSMSVSVDAVIAGLAK